MAAVVGNVALLLDVNSHRTVVTDRRIRLTVVDVVLNLPKRESHSHVSYYAALSSNKPLESEGDARIRRFFTRGKSNSKANAVDFDDAGSSDDGSDEEEEKSYDVEKEMKRRAKELQDMRELERKAEELQNKIDDEEGEDSEEKKRMRVKIELEKVAQEQAERRATAELMFELGQKAYGKGMYGRAIEFLEGALTIIPRLTLFGGENLKMNPKRCAACKYLRRRCSKDCVFSPYFPPTDPEKFACIHRIYGAGNVSKMLQQLPIQTRAEAVESLCFEAKCRVEDPVYGCVGIISLLQTQIQKIDNQLAKTQAEIVVAQTKLNQTQVSEFM